jgi:hypothetical protein
MVQYSNLPLRGAGPTGGRPIMRVKNQMSENVRSLKKAKASVMGVPDYESCTSKSERVKAFPNYRISIGRSSVIPNNDEIV